MLRRNPSKRGLQEEHLPHRPCDLNADRRFMGARQQSAEAPGYASRQQGDRADSGTRQFGGEPGDAPGAESYSLHDYDTRHDEDRNDRGKASAYGASIGARPPMGYDPGYQGGGYTSQDWAEHDDLDERLKADASERLRHSGIDCSNVNVDVSSGKVTLEGTVQERSMKRAIEDLVHRVPGVKDIDNRIRVERDRETASKRSSPVSESTGSASQSTSSISRSRS